jgi:membrane protease YdiL (CAAX protease family)
MEVEIPEVALGSAVWPAWLVAAAACGVAASFAVAAVVARRALRGEPVVVPRVRVPARWHGADVATATALYIGFQFLAAGGLPADASLHLRLAVGSLAMLAATATIIAMLRVRDAGWPALGFPEMRPVEDVGLAIGGLVLMLAPLLALAAVLDRVEPYRHVVVDFLLAHRDAASVALVAFAAVVAAPLAEEFLFRRVLQGWLEERLGARDPRRGPAAAVVLSALAFALAHYGQGLAWVPLFFFGLVVGYLARQTGSIVPGIILHGMFNAVSVGLVLLQGASSVEGGG